MGMRVDRGVGFLTDEQTRVVGYVDNHGRERRLDGTLIEPGSTPDPNFPQASVDAFAERLANPDDAEEGAALIGAPAGLTAADAVLTVKTMAELRALPVPTLRSNKTLSVSLLGYNVAGDGGGGRFYWQGNSNEAAVPGHVIVPESNPDTGRWKRVLDSTGYNVKHFGATGLGLASDAAAFAAWVAHLNGAPRRKGFIPEGVYDLTDNDAPLDILAEGITITGAGIGATVLKTGYGSALFSKASASARTKSLTLQGFTIEGPTAKVSTGGYAPIPISIGNVEEVVMKDVLLTKIPALAVAFRFCDRLTFNNVNFHEIARGGINIAECSRSTITGCRFNKLGDDVISLHNRFTAHPSVASHTVAGCQFYMGQGIKGVGAVNVAVVGCTFEFMLGHAWDISSNAPGALEGANTALSGTFVGNTIKDTFNNTYTSGANQSRHIIRLGGGGANGFGLDAIPTFPDSTGAIIRPEPYYLTYSSADSPAPVAPSTNFVISQNSIIQSLPESAAFSDFGYGLLWGYEGEEYDPPVLFSELLLVQFVNVDGYLQNTLVSDNVISGVDVVLGMEASSTTRNMVWRGNIITNIRSNVIELSAGNTTGVPAEIMFEGNTIDLDPFLANANRLPTGGWAANTANLPGAFIAPRGNSTLNIRALNNHMRNILNCTVDGHNTYYGDINVFGAFSTSNLGVGHVRHGNNVVLVDSDPTSPTYGQRMNEMLTVNNVMPTTGKYVALHFVRKTNPAIAGAPGSQYVVQGWLRLTTGDTHVLGTDWVECRAPTGT